MKRALSSVLVPFALVFLGGCTSSDSADGAEAPAASPSPTPASSTLTLHGSVVDGMTQAPLAAAPLVAADANGRELGATKANADGSYTLTIPVGAEGFDGTLAVSAPGYWTRRFFAPTKQPTGAPPRDQDVTFHMQSEQLVALQESMLGIDIDEKKAIVAMTVQDASGKFVAPDFPAEIDLDVPYTTRIYLDAMGRPDPKLTAGWFAIFLNVTPGPVTGTAKVDGTTYGSAKVVAKGRELGGSWIRP